MLQQRRAELARKRNEIEKANKTKLEEAERVSRIQRLDHGEKMNHPESDKKETLDLADLYKGIF